MAAAICGNACVHRRQPTEKGTAWRHKQLTARNMCLAVHHDNGGRERVSLARVSVGAPATEAEAAASRKRAEDSQSMAVKKDSRAI